MRCCSSPLLSSYLLLLLASCATGAEDVDTTFGTFSTSQNNDDLDEDTLGTEDEVGSEDGSSGEDSGDTDPTTESDTEPTTESDTEPTTESDTDPTTESDTDPDSSDVCGDGAITGAEVCEPGMLGGQTCVSQGFDVGALSCAGDCLSFDTSQCTNFVCGNGQVEGAEACDGGNLDGQTCISQGFDAGTLGCAGDCGSFNTAMCVDYVCGNGVLEGSESCDGANLNGQTCASQGFVSGSLSCAANCTFNTSNCSNVTPGGTCCTIHGTPGCSAPSIQACVCALDPYCCNNQWDSLCVDEAINDCGAGC